MLKAGCNIIGPNGEVVVKDEEVPGDWDKVFLDALLDGGAAYEVEEDEDGSE